MINMNISERLALTRYATSLHDLRIDIDGATVTDTLYDTTSRSVFGYRVKTVGGSIVDIVGVTDNDMPCIGAILQERGSGDW